MRILGTIKIKIKLRNFDENPLAIVTLNLNEEIEIRFCPILWTKDRKSLFFTMPSLKAFRYQNCAVILDDNEYKSFQAKVIQEFLKKAEEHYYPDEFKLIKDAVEHKEEEINIDEIPL